MNKEGRVFLRKLMQLKIRIEKLEAENRRLKQKIRDMELGMQSMDRAVHLSSQYK